MRLLLAAMLVAASTIAAQAEVLILGYRPGGNIESHRIEARIWKKRGTEVQISDWQMSAAGLQMIYLKRIGGNICYRKSGLNARPAIYLHQPTGRSGKQIANYKADMTRDLGARNTAIIGDLPKYGYKKFHPSAFGISACAVDKRGIKTKAAPQLWKP
jgi:hypothetical protein